MKKRLIPLIGLTIAIAVIGVVTGFTLGRGSDTPGPTIFFPQGQEETEDGVRFVMQALLFGELVFEEGSLRVNDADGVPSHLLIWPPDFTLSTENDGIQILNGGGEVVARVGDQLRISGGAVAGPAYSELVPDEYPGPYWIVGDEVGPAEATEEPSGLNPAGEITHGDPTYEEWISEFGSGQDLQQQG